MPDLAIIRKVRLVPSQVLLPLLLLALPPVLGACGAAAPGSTARRNAGDETETSAPGSRAGDGVGDALVPVRVPTTEPMTSAQLEAAIMLQDARSGGVSAEEAAALVRDVAGDDFPVSWGVADVDGNGVDEWIGVVGGDSCTEAQLWLVGLNDEVVQLDVCSPDPCQPCSVTAIGDLTDDGLNDVVVESIVSGAHTEIMLYRVISAHGGVLRNLVEPELEPDSLTDDSAEMSYATGTLEDATGDGTTDLVVRGGLIGSAGAGPYQREQVDVWSWNGEAIVRVESQPAPSDLRLFALYDANDAFRAQEWQQATEMYLATVNSDTLHDPAELPALRDAIRQFSAFRLILLALRTNDTDEAGRWGDWLANNYPETSFSEAAGTLLDAWTSNPDLSSACKKVTQEAEKRSQPWAPLDDMGYANPSLGPADLCPL